MLSDTVTLCTDTLKGDRQMEARPLSGFYHNNSDCVLKCNSIQETKQFSKFQNDASSNCFTIDVFKISAV